MPKADFYILEEASSQQALLFACRLLEKFYQEQKRAYVHMTSKIAAERLDDLLWTYEDNSFIPHSIYDLTSSAPIQIGYENIAITPVEILLNLATELPIFYQQFNQIIEIVFKDSSMQQLARERYRLYRDQQYEIQTYKLKANAYATNR